MESLDVTVKKVDTVDGLVELAWNELVEDAEKELPVYIDDSGVFKGSMVASHLKALH